MARGGQGLGAGAGYGRILWPADFSGLARPALTHAIGVAAGGGAELVGFHVLSPAANFAIPEVSGAALARMDRQNRAAGREELRRIAGEFKRKAPKPRVHRLMAEGSPATQIIPTAKGLKCDLIAIGTHGRTGLSHLLMGSVAERVVGMAPCPVLTVRHPGMRVERDSRGGRPGAMAASGPSRLPRAEREGLRREA